MPSDVLEIAEDATLQAAAKGMADARVNSLIIRPKGEEEPFGISTSPDIVEAIARNQDPASTLVHQTAAAPLVVVTPGCPFAYAARLLKRGNLWHLAVFNGRQIVGVLSAHDVVKAVGQWGSLLGRTATHWDEEPPVIVSPSPLTDVESARYGRARGLAPRNAYIEAHS